MLGGSVELFRHTGEAGRMETWLPSLPMEPQEEGRTGRGNGGKERMLPYSPWEITFKGAAGAGREGTQAAT